MKSSELRKLINDFRINGTFKKAKAIAANLPSSIMIHHEKLLGSEMIKRGIEKDERWT